MKAVYFFVVTIMLTAAGFTIQAQTAKVEQNETLNSTDKIEVYYFHFTSRCTTCRAVESVTRTILKETYPERMKEGMLSFKALNLDEPVNEQLADELHVSGQTLLFVKDGEKKDLTTDAFMYARSNPDKLKEKIIRTIDKL